MVETAGDDGIKVDVDVSAPRYYLCVDAGGTSLDVSIANQDGVVVGRGRGGPCNVKTVGLVSAVQQLTSVIAVAVSNLPPSASREKVKMSGVWMGLAGVDSERDARFLRTLIWENYDLGVDYTFGWEEAIGQERFQVSNDGKLLTAPLTRFPGLTGAITVVAGTGSIASAFLRTDSGKGTTRPYGTAGGWGHLIGDEGSGFSLGLSALRSLLSTADAYTLSACRATTPPPPAYPPLQLSPFHSALLSHLNLKWPSELLQKLYTSRSYLPNPNPEESAPLTTTTTLETAEAARKACIASAARIVLEHASSPTPDPECTRLVDIATNALVGMVLPLCEGLETTHWLLSLGGGLWRYAVFKESFTTKLEEAGVRFGEVLVVKDPADEGVKALVERWETERQCSVG